MKNILFYGIILILVSCGQNEKKLEISESNTTKTEEEIKQIERLKTLSDLSKQYDANRAFDTVKYGMTYKYQELLKENDRVVIDRFKTTNIEKIDTFFIVSIEKGFSRKLYIDFKCTRSQLENIYPNIMKNKLSQSPSFDKYLILKINNVKKIRFRMDVELEDNEEGVTSGYLEMKTSDAFFFKAELLGYYLKIKP